MTHLWLIRHGQTAWSVEGRHQGHADPPLTPRGEEEVRALLPTLRGVTFSAIYSSDLQRAHATARILGDALGLEVRQIRALRELNAGMWSGLLHDEVVARFPAEWAARQSDPVHSRPRGGESAVEVAQRVHGALNMIARLHSRGRVMVVSHGFALATVITASRGLPLATAFDSLPGHCEPVVVTWPLGPHNESRRET